MATKTFKIGRDAINGQFMTVKKAKDRPRTTTVETMKKHKKWFLASSGCHLFFNSPP